MKSRVTNLCTLFALLVMLSGVAHAMQHEMAHDDGHVESGHFEEFYEHSCVQADVSSDTSHATGILPPAFLTDAPHMPRARAPHQTFTQAQFARGPPATF